MLVSKRAEKTEKSAISVDATIESRRRQITAAWLSHIRSGSLVELKRGTRRNLFLVHDGEGDTLVYLSLARHLPEDIAVFAIEPRQLAGIPLAHVTIEDMAAFYIEAMRQKQPQGPYYLGGLCAGGVIAYEMASQLVSAGEWVALVALLEAVAPKVQPKPRLALERRLARLRYAIADCQGRGPRSLNQIKIVLVSVRKVCGVLRWESSEFTRRWWVRVRFRLLREMLRRKLAWPNFVQELTVRDIYTEAHERYAPKPLSIASVVLVRAQTGKGTDEPNREIYADESFGWRAMVAQLKVEDVEGGHSTMLQDRFVDSLARALLPYLQVSA